MPSNCVSGNWLHLFVDHESRAPPDWRPLFVVTPVPGTRPPDTKEDHMANYELQGSLLEACSCGAPCPCWIGEDPHGGKCDTFLAYRIDRGIIRGVDVGGVSFAIVAQVPGNILK